MVNVIDKDNNVSTFIDSKKNIGRLIISRIIELRQESAELKMADEGKKKEKGKVKRA